MSDFHDANRPVAPQFLAILISDGVSEGLLGQRVQDFLLDFLDGVTLLDIAVVEANGDGELEVHGCFLVE